MALDPNEKMALEVYDTELTELELQIAQVESDLANTRLAEQAMGDARAGQEATLNRLRARRNKVRALRAEHETEMKAD